MLVQGIGKLIYEPTRPGIKKVHRLKGHWLIAKVDNEIGRYYRWWVWRRFGLTLQPPMWGTHITVVNDRDKIEQEYLHGWKMYHKNDLKFHYSVDVKQVWKFWVVEVKSSVLDTIRSELGLKPYPFHITIGRMD